MNDKWVLITAGFSPESMVAAAKRVESQAANVYPFESIIRVSKENLKTYCPKLTEKYPVEISDSTPGFGYAAWKTEVTYNALRGDFGPCDGVVWVDAGCEINSTLVTRLKFKRTLAKASKIGNAVFALRTPEMNFTKNAVLKLFPDAAQIQPEIQYQATYFILHGETGLKISEEIFNHVYADFRIIDPTFLSNEESKDLILPKCEQSLLSMVVKSQNRVNSMKVPPAGNRGWRSIIRAISEPIWISRNRTGKSIIPKWLQLIP
jgi:hypothetical protein